MWEWDRWKSLVPRSGENLRRASVSSRNTSVEALLYKWKTTVGLLNQHRIADLFVRVVY
jgi:hypothetical protein